MKMLTKLLGLVMSFLLAGVIQSQANQDHVDYWNANCAAYHFRAYPYSLHASFRDMYTGSDIDSDFSTLIGLVQDSCGPLSPPPTPDVDAEILTQ